MELDNIWENVLRDDDEGNDRSKSNVDLAESIQKLDDNELTPFSLELPSSFENSPVVEMDELVSDHRSTPSNLEWSLNTNSITHKYSFNL